MHGSPNDAERRVSHESDYRLPGASNARFKTFLPDIHRKGADNSSARVNVLSA
jgi:hypothetical protein